MRGRRVRRVMRPRRVIHPIVRRNLRRQRRIMRRQSRRMLFGSFILLALAGSYHKHKFHRDDLDRIERYYDKPAEDLTEEELLEAMKKLGIKKLELTEEEDRYLDDSEDY
ncbi:MAG: hypothetical protein ACFFDS_10205 [Candidatus Thorarchaeota archaeon]